MRIIKNTFKILFLLVALFLVILPYAAKYGAVHFLKTEKNIQANVGDLNINLFTGKIGVRDVHLYGPEFGELHLGQLSLDISVMELFNKNILVESIDFHDFKTNVTELDKAWNVGGVHIPLADEVPKESEQPQQESKPLDWGYGVRSIAFSNLKVDVSSQYTDSHFILNKFKVNDLLSWYPANASNLELDLNINGDSFIIRGDVTPFISEPVLKTKVHINNIQLKPFLKSLKDLPFDEASVAVFSDFNLEVISRKEQLVLGINGSYGLKDIYLKDKSREIKLNKLFWDGAQKVTLPTQGLKIINLDGLFAIENVDVVDIENNAHVLQEKVELAGQYEIKLDDKSFKPDVVASATLMIDQLDINSLDKKTKLVSFDNWQVKKIDVKSIDDVMVGISELNNLLLLNDLSNEKLPPLAKLEKFTVSDIHYQSNNVEIAKIDFRHLNADVRLDKKGGIPAIDSISPKQDKAEADKEPKPLEEQVQSESSKNDVKSEKETFDIVLNEITVNSNSNIRFVDNSVTPIFDTKLHDLKLKVTNVDSINTNKPTNIDFGVKIDEYAEFVLKGKARPFSEKMHADLKANLDALELVPLSSYAGKFAGINIKRGTLDIDADIKVKDDILDVKNTFYMNQLTVESDDSEVSDNAFKDMPMPLDLTLDVLRDKNNVIKLDIPVQGNVNEPDFRLQDVYNKAMAKAMKFAATHYLMQAVQPLGLIITASKLAGKAMAPKFDPLIFEAGSSEISKDNQQHIKKLAGILKEKDKIRFTICGNATETDWKAIQALKTKAKDTKEAGKSESGKEESKVVDSRKQILLKLANDRTKLVKKYFVETYKIAPKRLLTCNGKITKDEEDKIAKPAVELTL